MATTTNYSWSTPDDTALVKDGAAAIRTLGSSIDTTTKNLNPSTTLGDIEYRSSTANTNTRLGIGTSGQVLTVSSGVPAWTTISSGGMTLISEQTASANSSLSFTSIAGTYKQLVLVWSGIYHSGSGSSFSLRFNNDATANAYTNNSINSTGTTAIQGVGGEFSYVAANGSNHDPVPFGAGTNNSTSATFTQAQGYLIIDNYASTTKYKKFSGSWHYYKNSATVGYTNVCINGLWLNASTITSLDIVRISGSDTFTNSTNTSIRLYGVS